MYFVTTKRDGYVLFCITPSERAALGVTERDEVHLLLRDGTEQTWRVRCAWPGDRCSHTDFMAALYEVDEPVDPERLLDHLPDNVRHGLSC